MLTSFSFEVFSKESINSSGNELKKIIYEYPVPYENKIASEIPKEYLYSDDNYSGILKLQKIRTYEKIIIAYYTGEVGCYKRCPTTGNNVFKKIDKKIGAR